MPITSHPEGEEVTDVPTNLPELDTDEIYEAIKEGIRFAIYNMLDGERILMAIADGTREGIVILGEAGRLK